METEIYYIGGSPCSGKTTFARYLAAKTGMYHLELDDLLGKYALLGSQKGWSACQRQWAGTPDEIWLREPGEQCRQEIDFYREIFPLIQDDLSQLERDRKITLFAEQSLEIPAAHLERGMILEGAALLPELMQAAGISRRRYICMTAVKEFQIRHYRKRDWAMQMLQGCSDQEQAFANWMERDVLFAEKIREQCQVFDYRFWTADGTQTLEELEAWIREDRND